MVTALYVLFRVVDHLPKNLLSKYSRNASKQHIYGLTYVAGYV